MSDSLKLKPLHPVATLLNHVRLIVVVTGILTLIFGAAVLFKVRPTYLSEAAIEVNLLYTRLLTYDHEKQFSSRTQYTDFIQTQVSYIVGFENVMATLNQLDLSQTALAVGEDEEETDLFFRFIKMLRVEPVQKKVSGFSSYVIITVRFNNELICLVLLSSLLEMCKASWKRQLVTFNTNHEIRLALIVSQIPVIQPSRQ